MKRCPSAIFLFLVMINGLLIEKSISAMSVLETQLTSLRGNLGGLKGKLGDLAFKLSDLKSALFDVAKPPPGGLAIPWTKVSNPAKDIEIKASLVQHGGAAQGLKFKANKLNTYLQSSDPRNEFEKMSIDNLGVLIKELIEPLLNPSTGITVSHQETFETLKKIIEDVIAAKKATSSSGPSGAAVNLETIKKRLTDSLKKSSPKDLNEFAKIFEIKESISEKNREESVNEVFTKALNQLTILTNGYLDPTKTKDAIANFIVRLNFNNFINLNKFPPVANEAQQKSDFNTQINASIGTSSFDWYSEFKNKLDTLISSKNPTKESFKVKFIETLVAEKAIALAADAAAKAAEAAEEEKKKEENAKKMAPELQKIVGFIKTNADYIKNLSMDELDGKVGKSGLITQIWNNRFGYSSLIADEQETLKKAFEVLTKSDIDLKVSLSRQSLIKILVCIFGLSYTDYVVGKLGLLASTDASGKNIADPELKKVVTAQLKASGAVAAEAPGSGSSPSPSPSSSETPKADPKQKLIEFINTKRKPGQPPPPPPPGAPIDLSCFDLTKELTPDEIKEIKENRAGAKLLMAQLKAALKQLVEAKKAEFEKDTEGKEVLAALSIK